jgi:hypothetical protein
MDDHVQEPKAARLIDAGRRMNAALALINFPSKLRAWPNQRAKVELREDREKGFFVLFDFTSDSLHEIESFFKRTHKIIVALTVKEILDEQIAKKLV